MIVTPAKPPVFFDTNVLIQTHVAAAPYHALAVQAAGTLINNGQEIWISRQVLREYAAVLTRPQSYTAPIASSDVARQLRLFEQNYRIAEDSAQVTAALCTLLDTILVGGKQVHDANIVATMQAYHLPILITLNGVDFARFSSVITVFSPQDVISGASS